MPEQGLAVALEQAGPIPLAAELNCAPGELVALVGPSGSGKSTILRHIAGLHRTARGHVRCQGESWFESEGGVHLSPQLRRVGFVFQDYALFPHLTALGNVSAALGHLARGQRRSRALALLDEVNLGGLERRLPRQLSGGQRQRVALARALAREPRALLLDEPFSAVDQITRRKLQQQLAALRRSLSVPIVLVTHDLDEATALADRMVVLHHGRTLQQGPPLEVTAKPQSALVARLVGGRNIFEGVVLEQQPGRGRTILRWLDIKLEAEHNPAFAPGQQASWLVPAQSIVMHRRDRPSRGDSENPVTGRLAAAVALGENTLLTIDVGTPAQQLSLSISSHVARRMDIAPGLEITVSLLADGIHLMPWEETPAREF